MVNKGHGSKSNDRREKPQISPEKRFAETLRQHRLRVTAGRCAILEILDRATTALSALDIIVLLKRHRLDKVTVYRAMDDFCKAGLVHLAYEKAGVGYYELGDLCRQQQCHPHFTCTDCGQTHCLPEAFVPLTTPLPQGYILKHQRVHLEGICAGCNGEVLP